MSNTYFLGRGYIEIADYVAGVLKAVKQFHCPALTVEIAADYAEHKNSSGAMRLLDARVAVEQSGKITMTLDNVDTDVFAMTLGGELTTDAGTSFSAKAFPTVALNDVIPCPGGYVNLASLAITDSAGSPVTLTLNTDYSVDLKSGLITFKNLGSYTQPFKAAGATTAATKIYSMATKATIEKFMRFVGVNLHDNSNVIADLYRVQIPPTKFDIKSDGNDFAKFEFSPMLLADPSAPFNAAFGQFGRLVSFA